MKGTSFIRVQQAVSNSLFEIFCEKMFFKKAAEVFKNQEYKPIQNELSLFVLTKVFTMLCTKELKNTTFFIFKSVAVSQEIRCCPSTPKIFKHNPEKEMKIFFAQTEFSPLLQTEVVCDFWHTIVNFIHKILQSHCQSMSSFNHLKLIINFIKELRILKYSKKRPINIGLSVFIWFTRTNNFRRKRTLCLRSLHSEILRTPFTFFLFRRDVFFYLFRGLFTVAFFSYLLRGLDFV